MRVYSGGGPSSRGTRPVRTDEHVRGVYASLRAQSDAWARRERKLADKSAAAAVLLEELFYALYSNEVQMDPETSSEFHWQFKVIAELLPLTEFQRLRGTTVGDVVASAMAAWRLADAVVKATAADGGGRRRWWNVRKTRDRDDPEDGDPSEGRRRGGTRERTQHTPIYSVLRAVHDVRGMADADERLRRVWGIAPGRRNVRSLDDIWRFVDDVRALPGFRTLTDAFEEFRTRLTTATRRRRRRPGRGVERLVGLARGADLERVIPEETVRLADSDLQHLFFEAYEHGRLLQARYEGDDRGPTGPIVCCMDASRSMNAPAALGRERFLWAKAVGLALLDLARRGRRPFVGICFASEQDVAVFELAAGEHRPDVAIAMAACDFDGGTNFQAPLHHALSHIERVGPHNTGHIVFITDGEAVLPERFRRRFTAAKARLQFRLVTVFIDGQHEELASVSDDVFVVRPDRLESWETAVSGVGQWVNAPKNGRYIACHKM